MANTLRIKRRASGGAAGAPASLANAELAYNEQDNTLYYGKGTGGSGGSATTVEAIAGPGAFVDKTTAQSIDGVKTFTSSPVAPTPTAGDSSTKVATTAFVANATSSSPQAANSVLAGPTSGGNATPTYRALVAADIPTITSSKISDFSTAADARIALQAGANGGLAQLDSGGKVPSAQLPAYVDDVLEYANLAAFPATGATGVIYVDLATNKVYRWSGTVYVNIAASPGSTDAVTEGTTNLYFTAARVLATVLTGLSTATSTAVAAADSILVAIGKLQAQVTARLVAANNLSDLASASSARTNLGLGTAAVLASSAVALTANNLSDLANVATARTNLGLGTMATQNANAVAITGGSIDGIAIDGGTF